MSDTPPPYQPPLWVLFTGPAVFFGIKYGVFGGRMSWPANIGLLIASLLIIVAIREYYKKKSEE
ncbi:MAG: hypothetical protein AAF741_10650 [Bacteroidota bacterium]